MGGNWEMYMRGGCGGWLGGCMVIVFGMIGYCSSFMFVKEVFLRYWKFKGVLS